MKGKEELGITDIKLNSALLELLVMKDEFLPAYLMDKKYWVTILLSEVSVGELFALIEIVFI
ncbi:MmcQ/YjbR family DNA-binding protein [Tetragenococcus halophilus]|uniref:MmcQ/YjbR family DNA-binding protein n=1 Tax=Tetragenococcus halophilus TaxID=51669 RepID=UPI001F3CB594|nr:MmcQ/YjbR family DNA-binding protein [Tetragenococcus halophilus]MCF1602261.1 MmcQ/YjbR family DNA-binding protein [Tetragenococcus halophilus]MDN6163054.1 MmcQ/YjbR family DNA-binding protein [Tetragenococcus halophilus]